MALIWNSIVANGPGTTVAAGGNPLTATFGGDASWEDQQGGFWQVTAAARFAYVGAGNSGARPLLLRLGSADTSVAHGRYTFHWAGNTAPQQRYNVRIVATAGSYPTGTLAYYSLRDDGAASYVTGYTGPGTGTETNLSSPTTVNTGWSPNSAHSYTTQVEVSGSNPTTLKLTNTDLTNGGSISYTWTDSAATMLQSAGSFALGSPVFTGVYYTQLMGENLATSITLTPSAISTAGGGQSVAVKGVGTNFSTVLDATNFTLSGSTLGATLGTQSAADADDAIFVAIPGSGPEIVTITDNNNNIATLDIAAPTSLSPILALGATTNTAVAMAISVTGGTGPYTGNIWRSTVNLNFTPGASGSTNLGAIAWAGSTGSFTDTVLTAGLFCFYAAVVTDAIGDTATTIGSWTVHPAAPLNFLWISDSIAVTPGTGGNGPGIVYDNLTDYFLRNLFINGPGGPTYRDITMTSEAIGGTATSDWLPPGGHIANAVTAANSAGSIEAFISFGGNDVSRPITAAAFVANLSTIIAYLFANITTLRKVYIYPTVIQGETNTQVDLLTQYINLTPSIANGTTIIWLPAHVGSWPWWRDCNNGSVYQNNPTSGGTEQQSGQHPATHGAERLGALIANGYNHANAPATGGGSIIRSGQRRRGR